MKATQNGMIKRLVALVLALVLMSSLVPDLRLVSVAKAVDPSHPNDGKWNGSTWQPLSSGFPESGGRYYLTKDITLRGRYTLSGDLYLDLNGYTISFRGAPNVSAIDIYDSYRWFYLYDSGSGGKIQKTQYQYDNDFVSQKTKYDRFVYLNANGGRFVMNGGTIQGFNAKVDGGAVCVDQGTFEMNGGTITKCGKVDYVGGAVYVSGSNSRFNMYGGTITDNSTTHGGGVALRNQGTFNMYGGTITENKASCDGGGVYAVDSTVNVYGGIIENNTAGWTGGGIGGCGNKCSINVSGGEIRNNRNSANDNSSFGGGGIGAWDKSRVTVSGSAKIYGNNANRGGGIIMLNSSLTVKGGELGENKARNSPGNGGYNGVYCYDGGTANYDGGGKYHYYESNDGYWPSLPAKNFTVTLDKNGGTGGTASLQLAFHHNLSNTEVASRPIRTGYVFDGYWTTKDNSGVQYYDKDGKPKETTWPYTGNQTLYAHWQPTYTITYDAAGGIGAPAKQEVRFGVDVTLSRDKPTKTGYTFKNWNTALDGTGTTYDPNVNATVQGGLTKDKAHPAVTLYAQWVPNTYKLELYSNDDTYGVNGEAGFITVKPENGFTDYPDVDEKRASSTDMLTDKGALWMTYGTMTLPSAEELGLTRNHYDFVGWNIYDGQDWSMYQPGTEYKVGLSSVPNGEARLYAAWKMKDFFTITYNANGGQGGPSQEARFDGDTFNLPPATKNPTRAGYTFKGWCTSPNGKSTGVASSTSIIMPGAQYGPVTDNVTFYAQWEANKTVSFNANGGVFAEAPVVLAPAQGETVTGLFNNIPERTGHNFVGWSETKNGPVKVRPDTTEPYVMGDHAVVLYAKWEKKNYPVSFVGGNADLATSTNLATSTTLAVPYNGTLEFTVTVNLEQHNPDNLQVTVNGAQVAIPMPTGSGNDKTYTFVVNNVTEAQEVAISGVSARTYPLTLYPEGGTNAKSDLTSYYYGQALVLPTATDLTRTGYTFDGWYTAKNGGGKVEIMPAEATGAKAYYAKWQANSYTIKYDANGGSTTPTDLPMTYGVSKALANGAGTYADDNSIKFLGWSTDKNALTPMYQAGQKVKNLTAAAGAEVTLYAVWRLPAASMTTLTYDGNGVPAMDLGARSVKKGSTVTLEFPKTGIVFQGKQFAGWSTVKDGAVEYAADETTTLNMGTDPVVLYAQWTDVSNDTYTVIYYADSETAYASQTNILFGTAVTLATITDIGEGDTTLLGWSKDPEATVPEYLPGAKVTGLASTVDETVVKLYAVMGEKTRTFVTFDANGGQWSDGSTVKAVERATGTSLPTNPTKPGCVFKGWYNSADAETTQITSMNDDALATGENHTVYAHWNEINQYTVRYHHGDKIATKTALMGSPTTLSYPTELEPETGKEFKGWAIASNSDVVKYLDGQTITYPSQATLDLYAVWKGTEYYLTYDDNGGTGGPGTVIVYKDTTVPLSSKEPVYEGHKFNGWASGTDLLATNTKLTITGNMTLLASWTELDECRVTYDANGGVGGPVDTKTHYVGETVSILYDPQPGKTGYTFDGWKFGGQVYNQPTDTDIQLSTNTNFVAQWKANTYSICFDPGVATQTNISKTMASMTDISYGSDTTLSANEFAAPEGKEFAGWSFTVDGKPIYGNGATVRNLTAEAKGVVTLYAVWKDGAYTITLRNHSPLASDTTMPEIVKGQPLPTPNEAPTRTGYTFAGYYSGYDAGKGEVTGEQYYDAALNGLKLFDLTTNTDLHAKWIPQTLRVIYMQDGKEISKDTVTYDQNYTFSNRALDGTVIKGVTKLAGWSENEEPLIAKYDAKGVLTKDMVNALWGTPNNGNDLTLFAVLRDDTKYTVTYNANGGVNFPVDENGYTEGTEVTIICTGTDLPTKNHYVFKGWAATANATSPDPGFEVGSTTAKLTIKKNHILYAVWEPVKYTVTFNGNDGLASGTNLATQTILVTYDNESESTLLAADSFVRSGYTLVAWARDEKGTVVVGLPGDSMSQTMTGGKACTLYAVWSAKGCDVTFNENYKAAGGSTPTDITTYAYDAKLGTLPKPERDGYVFQGWYKDANCTGNPVDKSTPAKEVLAANSFAGTLYAKWSPKAYAISVSSDCVAKASYTSLNVTEHSIGKPTAPFRETVQFVVKYDTANYTGVKVYYNNETLTATGSDLHYEFTVDAENALNIEATGYKYSIVYHSNYAGGSPNIATNTDSTVEKLTLAGSTTFSRTGYELIGWATNAKGSVEYNADDVVNEPLTTKPGGKVDLYAVWGPADCKVFFDENYEGAASPDFTDYAYDAKLGTLPLLSRNGYVFEGWYKDQACTDGKEVNRTTLVSSLLSATATQTTLYAKWTPNDYAIRVESNCGAVCATGTDATATDLNGKKLPYNSEQTFKVTGVDFDNYTGVTVQHNGETLATNTNGEYKFKVDTENTITVNYTDYKYTVKYDANNGTGSFATQTALGSEQLTLKYASDTNFVKEGYNLAGWAERANGIVDYDLGKTVTAPLCRDPGGEVTLYAVWLVDPSTIIFDTNGADGDAVDNYVRDYNAALGVLPTVSREGYTFDGWYYTAAASTTDVKATSQTKVSEILTAIGAPARSDITLKAKWTEKTFTVTYMNAERTEAATTTNFTYTQKDAVNAASYTNAGVTVGTGYTFRGWTCNSAEYSRADYTAGQTVDDPWNGGAGVVLYPVIVKDATYTVTYHANGGTGFPVDEKAYYTNDKATVKYDTIPTREHYVFQGWAYASNATSTDFTEGGTTNTITMSKDVTLYAVWKAETYKVIFNANEGNGSKEITVTYGQESSAVAATATNFTRENYELMGWSLSKTGDVIVEPGKPLSMAITGGKAITLYAVWATADYKAIEVETNCDAKVTFGDNVENGFLGLGKSKAQFGKTVTFTVSGIDTNYTDVTVKLNGTTVLTPTGGTYEFVVSDKNVITIDAAGYKYTVTYSANGGTGSDVKQNATSTDLLNLLDRSVAFERDGYTLTGWALNRLGGVRYEPGEEIKNPLTNKVGGNVDLYAVWTVINDYTVIFYPDGGTLLDSDGKKLETIQYAYGDKLGVLPVPTKTGYTFEGWYNGDTRVTKDTEVKGSMTLTAKWKVNSYDIATETNCGASVSYTSGSVTSGKAAYGQTVKFKVTGVDFDSYNKVVVKINGEDQSTTVTSANAETAEFSFTVNLENTITVVQKNYKYYVAYDNNGGEGEIATQTVIDGEKFTLSSGTDFHKNGAELQGWATTPKGAVAYELSSEPSKALTTEVGGQVDLYAVWKANTYTITFDAGEDGSAEKEFTRTYNDAVGTLPVPTRAGYTFKGWYIDLSKENTKVTAETKVGDIESSFEQVGDGEYTITLNACWTTNTYDVTVHRPNDEVGLVKFATKTNLTVDNETPMVDDAAYNTEIEFTVTPTPGYKMKNLIVTANGTPLECDKIEANVGTFHFTLAEDTVLLVHDGGSGANYTVSVEGYTGTYDGENHELKAIIAPEGLSNITYQWYVDNHLINGATQSTYKVKNVADSGTYKCVIKALDLKNGNTKQFTSNDAVVKIDPKQVTVSVVAPNIYYGQSKPNFSITYSGFAAAETKSVVRDKDTITVDCAYVPGSAKGSYTATPVIDGISADNYTFEVKPGTLVVNARPIVVSWSRDPANPWLEVTARIINLFGSDTLGLTLTGNTATSFEPAQYTAVVTAISGNSNYTLERGSNLSHNWSVFMRSEGNDMPVWHVALDQHEATWSEGLTLNASVYPENAADKTVIWSSSDESVVTVDNNGVVTKVREGTAIITVTTADGGCMDSCVVTVEPDYEPVFDMTLDRMSAIITTQNGTVQLNSIITGSTEKPTFTSSDEIVATVDENGLITGLSTGSATITATLTSDNGEIVTATCDVIVFISDTKTVASIDETALNGTYLITYTDGSNEYMHYNVSIRGGGSTTQQVQQQVVYKGGSNGKDGVGIRSIEKTGTKDNIDTYTITYTDGTTSTFIVTNGVDGHTPVITIGDNGNWFIDGIDSGKNAVVKDGTIWGFVGLGVPMLALIAFLYLKIRKLEKMLVNK